MSIPATNTLAPARPTCAATRTLDSPLGTLTLHAQAGHLTRLILPAANASDPDPAAPRRRDSPQTAAPATPADHALLDEAARQLDQYFAGHRLRFELPTAPTGTDFQRRVWTLLNQIPAGQTRTYTQLAQQLGQPRACRAVGLANHRNPLPILQPCHRVVGHDGRLVGFAGGLPAKRWLLDHENATAPLFTHSA